MNTQNSNEFESIAEEDFSTPSAAQHEEESLIAESSSGKVYDYMNAPDRQSTAKRVNLDGKKLIIQKAEIIMPPADRPFQKTRDGSKDFKFCVLKLYYPDNQVENYSGLRTFKRVENGKEKLSHPSVVFTGENQVASLARKYASFKGIDINKVTLRDFLIFLNGKPMCIIKKETVINPQTNEKVDKNIVQSFL